MSTLSVALSTFTPSSSTTPTTATSTTNNSSLITHGNTNYFFGFIIAFIIVLVIFVACALFSRRHYFRARNHPTMLDTASERSFVLQDRPKLWEPVVAFEADALAAADADAKLEWGYVTPLSASFAIDRLAEEDVSSPSPERILNSTEKDAGRENMSKECPLQVVMLIAMPHRHDDYEHGDTGLEYEFGTVNVIMHDHGTSMKTG